MTFWKFALFYMTKCEILHV